jgi:nucleotide-binding universal stress UspA family protein
MDFRRFERRAREIFDGIPAELRHGVDYVVAERGAVPHPTMPGIYTLGECATGEHDPGDALPGDLRSGVHLYHGSFRELAKRDPEFDWEEELWETITHEVRHHRESAAGEDALEELDWAGEENFKRRDGKDFNPFFYRAGIPVAPNAWEVDGDLFVEREIGANEFESLDEIGVTVGGEEIEVPLPQRLGDVHFVRLAGLWDDEVDVMVVLVRRRGGWEQLGSLLSGRAPQVLQSTMDYDIEDRDEDDHEDES